MLKLEQINFYSVCVTWTDKTYDCLLHNLNVKMIFMQEEITQNKILEISIKIGRQMKSIIYFCQKIYIFNTIAQFTKILDCRML